MCGIAGVVAFDSRLAIDRPTLDRMSDCIAHRGPDGQGVWMDGGVALAHRRLAVLDPDPRSNQPFTDGRRWLVYNGEIYNFREVKSQLPPREWKTTGDTEVLLAAYEAWGENCVDHLNGMFAIAIWDAQERTLFLARDRMGQKPLYIAQAPGALAFASEIGALLAVAWVDQSMDDQALVEYLRWGYVPTPRTIYRGITQLMPAQTMLIDSTTAKQRIYFDPNQGVAFSGDLVRETHRLVDQAVRRQLVSDVPLGCFISGGMDSSVIAAAMARDRAVLTFSIGFDDPRYDESEYAAAVAKHLRTEHREFSVRPDAAADLHRIAAAFGQPMADSSALPTHYLARETRRHVTVTLSGDGGDELFGGYDRYRAMRMPQIPWRMAAPLIGAMSGTHPKSAAAKLRRLAASANLPDAQRYAAYMRLTDEETLRSLLVDPPNDTDSIAGMFSRQDRGPAEAAMAVDRVTYLPDDLLTKVDRCSMLHALEVRSPFMDHELVQFASSLKGKQVIKKRLLREAFAADLPAWVFRRKKMGFAVPIGDWLRTSLRTMLHDLLFASDSLASQHFRRPAVEAMVREHERQTLDHSQRLYALLMLELWHRAQRTAEPGK